MDKTQKIVWTVLPNGITENGKLKLSVFVSPRLGTDDASVKKMELEEFPDFLLWPEKVEAMKFEVQYWDGSTSDPTTVEAEPKFDLDAEIGDALFNKETVVIPYKFTDYEGRIIRSYPVRDVVSYTEKTYRTIAENSPDALPMLDNDTFKNLANCMYTPYWVGVHELNLDSCFNTYLNNHKVMDPDTFQDIFQDRFQGRFPDGYPKETIDFYQSNRFYDRPDMKPDESVPPQRPEKPEIDFHQMLASLGDHPMLMCKLGLVLDMVIPVPDNNFSYIRLIPLWGSDEPPSEFNEDLTPWTRYDLTDKRFMAKPKDSKIVNGMLNLKGVNDNSDNNGPIYDLVQVDPDGAALQLLNFTSTLIRITDGKEIGTIAYDTPDYAGLPSLRTAGIALAEYKRDLWLSQHFSGTLDLNKKLEKNDPDNLVELYAEDLVRGYRVDMKDGEDGQWRSLCQRVGTYTFPAAPVENLSVDDEGYVKSASTTSKDADNSDLYLHQTMFHWDGWSLCAQRPGKTIVPKTEIETDASGAKVYKQEELIRKWPDDTDFKLTTGLNFEHIFGAKPGSLPRLRFGHTYRMRVRVVDIAGNSEKLGSAESSMESDPLCYARFEPVSSPTIVPRAILSDGESVERMVIRSDFDKTTEGYINSDEVQAALVGKKYLFSWDNVPGNDSERLLIFLLDDLYIDWAENAEIRKSDDGKIICIFKDENSAEIMIDEEKEKATLKIGDGKVIDLKVKKENGKLNIYGKKYIYDIKNERHIVPPKTSQLMAEFHEMFDGYIGQGKEDNNYDTGYNIALKEEGTLKDRKIVDIETGILESIPNKEDIEFIKPEGAGPSSEQGQYLIHKEETLLLPYLPDPIARGAAFRDLPGVIGVGEPGLEKEIAPDDLNVLKVPFDCKAPFDGAWPNAAPFRIRICEWPCTIEGTDCGDMCESFTDSGVPEWDCDNCVLTVYLAKAQIARVQYSCYLNEDDLAKMGIWKWLPDSADLDKLKQYALSGTHWMITPCRELVLVHAVQRPLCGPTYSEVTAENTNIGNTYAEIYGHIRLSVKSTGKIDIMAEWSEEVDILSEPGPKTSEDNKAHVSELNIKESKPYDLLAFRHEFGDTKYRLVSYYLVGTTRFREYFPPEITKDAKQITREGPKCQPVKVLSSARPAAPKVLYVLPTFGWVEQKSPINAEMWNAIERKRIGGGLRVYLERPWYSSGDGELLGVVLFKNPSQYIPDKFKPYVTQVGMDPIWESSEPNTALSAQDFVNYVQPEDTQPETEFSLEEIEQEKVRVVGYKPEYNKERQLWYCDIQFKPERVTSYYPFVRLALARYQPNSISDAHLSRVVLTDFAQLVPDRMLRIQFRNEKQLFISVSGYAPIEYRPYNNSVWVSIETRNPQIQGDLGWFQVAGTSDQELEQTLIGWGHFKWESEIWLPEPRGSRPFRVVVKEYEPFETDTDEGVASQVRRGRVVYADVVEL